VDNAELIDIDDTICTDWPSKYMIIMGSDLSQVLEAVRESAFVSSMTELALEKTMRNLMEDVT
jgi:Mor family transcriptional regulator